MVGATARGQKLIVPSGSDVIKAGDTVYFAYKPTSQRALLRALHKTRGSLGTACIVGGGNIGLRLARLLENKGVDTKLIDHSEERCDSWRTSCRVRWSCTATARTSPSCRKSILIRWTPSSR